MRKFEYMIDWTKEVLKVRGEFPPTFFAFNEKEEMFIIPGNFRTDAEKIEFLNMLKVYFTINSINHYMVANEGWLSDRTDIRPTDDPNRKSIITFMSITEVEKILRTYEISRNENDEKDVTLTEMGEPLDFGGRFSELLPPKDLEVPPFVKEDLEELFEKIGVIKRKVEYDA